MYDVQDAGSGELFFKERGRGEMTFEDPSLPESCFFFIHGDSAAPSCQLCKLGKLEVCLNGRVFS